MSIENLQEQLSKYEQELEAAKAHVYRLDGIIQFLRHQIKEAESTKED